MGESSGQATGETSGQKELSVGYCVGVLTRNGISIRDIFVDFPGVPYEGMPFRTAIFLTKTFQEQDLEKARMLAGIIRANLAAAFSEDAAKELTKFIANG